MSARAGSELSGDAADDDRPERDALNDVRTFGAHDFDGACQIAYAVEHAETPALGLERNDAQAFGFEPRAVLADARRHGDVKARLARRARHRQKMRDEEPVFGDKKKQLGHRGSHPPASILPAIGTFHPHKYPHEKPWLAVKKPRRR